MQRLMEGLVGMQDFIEAVKGRTKEQVLLITIIALLHLLEDTCHYIINSLSQNGVGMYIQPFIKPSLIQLLFWVVQTMRGLVDAQSSDKITSLMQKFAELKANFDRAVGVGALNQLLTIGESIGLD